jgi:hypothetical protein
MGMSIQISRRLFSDCPKRAVFLISDSERSIELVPSHFLGEPLEVLTEGVIYLLKGRQHVNVRWQDEPGEYRWILEQDGDEVHVTILGFRDTFSRKRNEDGEPLFTTTCRLTTLAGQVRAMCNEVLRSAAHDPDNRELDWLARNHDELVRLLKERRAGRSQG